MTDIIEENIENPDKAEVWLSRSNPHHRATNSIPNFQEMINHQFYKTEISVDELNLQKRYIEDSACLLTEVASKHLKQHSQQNKENMQTLNHDAQGIMKSWQKINTPDRLWQEWLSYSTDSSKRLLQTVDVLKERVMFFLSTNWPAVHRC